MQYGSRGRPAGSRRRDDGGPQENVTMLTAENFSSVKKRRKILPAGAMKRNSGCNLYSLDRSYRFFCSATGRWLVADEVAYDEKLSSFQSVKEFSRAVRPRSGQKQEVNFWPQLGVGETRYQTLTSVPTAAHNNPAAAFVYADDSRVVQKRPAPEQQQQHVPQQQQPMAPPPMGSMPHPGQMLPPHMAQQAQPVPVQLHLDTATTKDGDTLFGGSQADGATEHGESIFGDDKSTLFGGDGATEMGSQIDHEEMHERERQQAERIKKVMEQAKVQRHQAQSALNEFDTMDAVPKRGSKTYSTWMTEFTSKHGFKPDILVTMFAKK